MDLCSGVRICHCPMGAARYAAVVSVVCNSNIPASGWSSDSTAGCPYYLDIPVSGLTANDCVAVVVAPTCAKTALTAGLTSTESFAGKLRLRAQQTPTAAITAVYYIVK